jgi:hypothetical protein
VNVHDHGNIREPRVDPSVEVSALIAALHLAGADKFDPVGLHYLDVLTQRANAHQGSVRRILEGKLAQALEAFRKRFEHAQRDAQEAIDHIGKSHPQARVDLQRLLESGDVKGVRQGVAILKTVGQSASLGELSRHIAQHSSEMVGGSSAGRSDFLPELKATQYFRNTWSKLSVERRVRQALGQAPKNAGPINSHMLVLRSLALMREISPDYLNQFTSYVDALLCLDQCDKEASSVKPVPKKLMRLKGKKQ